MTQHATYSSSMLSLLSFRIICQRIAKITTWLREEPRKEWNYSSIVSPMTNPLFYSLNSFHLIFYESLISPARVSWELLKNKPFASAENRPAPVSDSLHRHNASYHPRSYMISQWFPEPHPAYSKRLGSSSERPWVGSIFSRDLDRTRYVSYLGEVLLSKVFLHRAAWSSPGSVKQWVDVQSALTVNDDWTK